MSAREQVLEATRACLVERGVAGTTTSEIARRAGVAEGTIFRHFRTKAVLWHELAARVLADVRADATAELDAMADQLAAADPVEAIDHALAVVWRQYARDDLVAVHELFMAARTDPDLATLLDELNGPHRDELHRLGRRVLPAAVSTRPDVAAIVDFVIDGVATIGMARHAGDALERLAVLRAAVHGLVAAPPVHRDDAAHLAPDALEVPA